MRRLADGIPLIAADSGAQEPERVQHDDPAFNEGWLICTKLPTQHGPVGNLLMTATGDIVLAETKLWRNPEA